MAHVPGKDLIVADTLSRAPLSIVDTDNEEFQQEVEAFINSTIQQLPDSEARLKEIMNKQQNDATSQIMTKYCQDHWPDHRHIESCAKPYLLVAAELSVCNGLLLRGDRIVIPLSMQSEILGKLHCGHQGITKYCE